MNHQFTPWKIEGGRCVLLSDEREAIKAIDRCVSRGDSGVEVIHVTADPFTEFEGEVVDSNGVRLCKQNTNFMETISSLRTDLFRLITECPHLNFWLVTEHLGRVREAWPEQPLCRHYDAAFGPVLTKSGFQQLPNVTLFAQASNQPQADERIPQLLKLRELVGRIGVVYEPVEGVDLRSFLKLPGMPDRIVKPGSSPIKYLPVDGIDHLWIQKCRVPLFMRPERDGNATDAANQATAAGVECWNEFEK